MSDAPCLPQEARRSDQSVLGLEEDLHVARKMVRDHRGNPDAKVTSMPGASSRAIRRAMMSCGLICASRIGDEVVDQRRWRPDVIGSNQSDRNDIFRARDHGAGRERGSRD